MAAVQVYSEQVVAKVESMLLPPLFKDMGEKKNMYRAVPYEGQALKWRKIGEWIWSSAVTNASHDIHFNTDASRAEEIVAALSSSAVVVALSKKGRCGGSEEALYEHLGYMDSLPSANKSKVDVQDWADIVSRTLCQHVAGTDTQVIASALSIDDDA